MLNAIAEILQDIAYPPLPDGLCVVELFGHNRTRGTVRRRWYGLRPMVEITSHEPDGGTTHCDGAVVLVGVSLVPSNADWRKRARLPTCATCWHLAHRRARRLSSWSS